LHRGSARIRLSEGSIGHVEYWFEQRLGLRMAALENKAGNFITPTAHAGELALSGRVAQVQELAASVADPSGADAYPLVSYSWMLVYAQYGIRPRQLSCVSFAGWSLSDRGQDYGAQLGYLQLSSDVLSIGRQALVN
jgi:phosphate transport system substrate-binding protein